MVNKVKQVVGYGVLNFILFAIVSIVFSVNGSIEWRSLITVAVIISLASLGLYYKQPMAIYLMFLAILFVAITLGVALWQLFASKAVATGMWLVVDWMSVLISIVSFILWVKTTISYRRQAGIYFRE